uniref:NH(3)-dependent NAD(+) synthetase n=1 Tax=uncultured Atribacterota bacterium TaxID=263865 RepID=G3BMS3_9BACT|nr:NAD synthase [uncultured Atribacterota bacterium]
MAEDNTIKNKILPSRVEKLINWIKTKVKVAGKRGVIYGLSGGLDSAVVAICCKLAFPDNSIALILPCESKEDDLLDAMTVVEKFQIKYQHIDLTPVYQKLLSIINSNNCDNKLARANIKPRLRMIVLYYFANILEYLVVGTGNKSEISIGYFTKYGDGGVDILPLGNILKSEIFEIARLLEVPDKIIAKPPSAGLWENQTDEQEMGFSYEQLDNFLKYGKIQEKEVEKVILRMKRKSAHKRKLPPSPKI